MSDRSPVIVWFRRDLRLSDHAALATAAESGRPVVPVFIRDNSVHTLGAAPKWRLGEGLSAHGKSLESLQSRLVLRSGNALETLRSLIEETGATSVFWSRLYDREARQRDSEVKAALKSDGIEARSFAGHLLHEPWDVRTGGGGVYRVFTPFWRAVRSVELPASRKAPSKIVSPTSWPSGEALSDWSLGAAMHGADTLLANHVDAGEAAAQDQLAGFLEGWVDRYSLDRDRLDREATSGLGAALSLGEVSPLTCWHAGLRAHHQGRQGAEAFLRQLVWRDFAGHLLYHWPNLDHQEWREEWRDFPWDKDESRDLVQAWKQGRTGIPAIDAAMRELMVTGTMHNRGRMITGSFLTKHLLADWRIGLRWFEDHLVDWDPANNAMGWQWVAGCGPDAAPYFRVFNPELQQKKFDPKGAYVRRWIAEGQNDPPKDALDFFAMAPRSWGLAPSGSPAMPVISLPDGRARALAAYHAFRNADPTDI